MYCSILTNADIYTRTKSCAHAHTTPRLHAHVYVCTSTCPLPNATHHLQTCSLRTHTCNSVHICCSCADPHTPFLRSSSSFSLCATQCPVTTCESVPNNTEISEGPSSSLSPLSPSAPSFVSSTSYPLISCTRSSVLRERGNPDFAPALVFLRSSMRDCWISSMNFLVALKSLVSLSFWVSSVLDV